VLERSVANAAAVEQQVLHPVIGPTVAGIGNIAFHSHLAVAALNGDQVFGQVTGKQSGNAIAPIGNGGQIVQYAVIVTQRKVDLWKGQGNAGKRLGDVAHLGRRSAQELAPHRRVVEQVANFQGAAYWAPTRRNGASDSANHF